MRDSVWCFVFCILILSDVARFNLGSEGGVYNYKVMIKLGRASAGL